MASIDDLTASLGGTRLSRATPPLVKPDDPRASVVDNSPPLPEGKGGKDALTEALMVGIRASNPCPKGLSKAPAPPAPPRKKAPVQVTEKVLTEGPWKVGDIVQHQMMEFLATVSEVTDDGILLECAGLGTIAVQTPMYKHYKLAGKGV